MDGFVRNRWTVRYNKTLTDGTVGDDLAVVGEEKISSRMTWEIPELAVRKRRSVNEFCQIAAIVTLVLIIRLSS